MSSLTLIVILVLFIGFMMFLLWPSKRKYHTPYSIEWIRQKVSDLEEEEEN